MSALQRVTSNRRTLRGTGLAFILLLLMIGPLVAMLALRRGVGQSFAWFETNRSGLSIEDIERFTDVDLPAGATNVQSNLSGSGDLVLRARFDLPAADLPDFLAGTRFPPLAEGAVPPLIADPFEQPWWKPLEVRRFQAAKTSYERPGAGRLYQAVLIDTAGAQTYTVYLAVFST